MFGWAEMLILLISRTRVIKSEPSVDQVPVRPNPVSHELPQSSPSLWVSVALLLLLKEGMSTWPMPGHPLTSKTASLAETPPPAAQASVCVCVHAPSQSVPHVAIKNCHNVSRFCPSACTRPLLLSHCVSLIKTGLYASAFRHRDGLWFS